MTDDNIRKNARTEIAMAKDALRVATAAVDLGICRDAMSRAYYAAFHAARAFVMLAGYEAKTHAGLRHLFSEQIVRPGILETRSLA